MPRESGSTPKGSFGSDPEQPKIVLQSYNSIEDSTTDRIDVVEEHLLPQSLHTHRQQNESRDTISEKAKQHTGLLSQSHVIPESIHCSLLIKFAVEPPKTFRRQIMLNFNEVDGYKNIEHTADRYVKEEFADDLDNEEFPFFRRGKCIVVSRLKPPRCFTLSSQASWKMVYTEILKSYALNTDEHIRLEVERDYDALSKSGPESIVYHQIGSLMKTSFSGRPYISCSDLDRIMTIEAVEELITSEAPAMLTGAKLQSFIQEVHTKAPKLLAMCIFAEISPRCFIYLFIEKRLYDDKLPLAAGDCCHRVHKNKFDRLVGNQGGFSAAQFNIVGDHQSLSSDTVVPIYYHPTEGNEKSINQDEGQGTPNLGSESHPGRRKSKDNACCGTGAFSAVYRVKIDPDHHQLSEVCLYRGATTIADIRAQDKYIDFAVKQFKYRPKYSASTFEKELRILDELSKHRLKHIVTHLASWTQDDEYYMLFPYAQSNLRQYMQRYQYDPQVKETNLWLLNRFRDLALAIKAIHNLTPDRSQEPVHTLSAPPSGMRKSGWHHDLKPENILFFPEYALRNPTDSDWDAGSGTFSIADFGSGKVSTYRSGSANTRSPNGTLTYEPPEATIEGATSRPYDVWSLGCVFLEMLIWAFFGCSSVSSFTNDRHDKKDPERALMTDAFWQINENKKLILRPSVVKWIEKLKERFEKNPTYPFMEVVELIEDRMLDLNRTTRISALDLEDTLGRICEQKEIDLRNTNNDPSDIRLSLSPPNRRSSDLSPQTRSRSSSGRSFRAIMGDHLSASPDGTSPVSGRLPHRGGW
ncbi:MAG: hypothetical protein Q9190_000472 [Brigantiaea leucoxantha]